MDDTVRPEGAQHLDECCIQCQDEGDYHYVDWVHMCCCRSIAASDDRDDVLDAIRTMRLRKGI